MEMIELLRHPDLDTVLGKYCKEWLTSPSDMAREHIKYLSRWLLGNDEVPEHPILFENHCHSHFSDGPELSAIIDTLFEKDISLWSLTDHDNSKAFDFLVNGDYSLADGYDIEASQDRRHLILHHGERELVMLRSTELMTDKGEIGVHGYDGTFPEGKLPLKEAVARAIDMGGYVVINHPYYVNLSLGFHDAIEEAVDVGAIAFEKNGVEIPPLIYSAVRAGLHAEQYGLALIAAGDAHILEMYGKSGVSFDEDVYSAAVMKHNGAYSAAIQELITHNEFENYLNYLTPREFMRFTTRVPELF